MIDYNKLRGHVNALLGLETKSFEPTPQLDEIPTDEVTRMIFAPNPLTGFALSSLELQLNGKTEKAIQDYLVSFNKAFPSKIGCDNDEDAFASAPPRALPEYALNEYLNNLAEIANSTDESNESKSL